MICELEDETFSAKEFETMYKKNLGNPDIYYWIAELNNKAIGCISLYIQNLLHHNGPVAEIQELFVDSDQRGGGIGTHLVDEARKQARERGCKMFEVTTNVKREATHRFYERCGFQRTHYKFTEVL